MAASAAIPGYGTILQVDFAGTGYDTIGEIPELSGPTLERNVIRTTHMESVDNWHEFIAGILDAGEVTALVQYVPTDVIHKLAIAHLKDTTDDDRICRIVWNNKSFTRTVSIVNDTLDFMTTSIDHEFVKAQPIIFSTTGNMPAPLIAGRLYYARQRGVALNEFEVFPTSHDVVAGTNLINITTPGTGTLTVKTGTEWRFTSLCLSWTPRAVVDDRLLADLTLKIDGANTIVHD